MIDYYSFLEEVGKELGEHDVPDELTYIIMAHQEKSENHQFCRSFITANDDNNKILALIAMFLEEYAARYEKPVEDILDILAKVLDVYVPEDQRGVQWDPDDEDPEAR